MILLNAQLCSLEGSIYTTTSLCFFFPQTVESKSIRPCRDGEATRALKIKVTTNQRDAVDISYQLSSKTRHRCLRVSVQSCSLSFYTICLCFSGLVCR